MAKYFGSLVGTPLQSGGFPGISNFLKDGSEHIIVRDKAALTTANLINDVISLGVFRSTAFLSETSILFNDALGTGVTLNIGDVNYPSGLASGLSVASQGSANLWATFRAAKMGYPLWQALGYASDPGGTIELLAIIAGANVGTAGSLAWRILGINR